MLETFTLETFTQCLNSIFKVSTESGTVDLELIEGGDYGSTPGHVQFSITFRGPREKPLSQRMYPMEHAELGSFDLFIVPIRHDKDGIYYEAVFNRVH